MKQLHYYIPATFPLLICLCLLATHVYAEDEKIKSPEYIPGSNKVDAEGVIELAGSIDELIIIDSRITDDRRQGYIEGSISLPDENTDCNTLAIHLETIQTPALFYCNGPKCGRSGKAVKIALSCGYKNIYWFRGGFEEWQAKDYPFLKE
jgi:rhodanese-related sulfurtransferase